MTLLLESLTLEPRNIALLIGVGLIGFYFLMRASRKNAKSGETTLLPEEQIERLRQSRGMHGDLEKLMIEIEELAQRWGKRLDTKATQIDRLLEEADAKIAELKRLRGEAVDGRPREGLMRETREPREGSDSAAPVAGLRLRMTRGDGDFAEPQSADAASRAAPPPRSDPAHEFPADPLAASVYKLADAGHESVEIAKKLNEEIGKVELILALRRA